MKPDPSHCRAFFYRGYYDMVTKACGSFVYDGSNEVVPFDTVEACKKVCEGGF